jgi:ferredoxin, 2Fe-2S
VSSNTLLAVPVVRVEPLGVEIDVDDGETLMAAAERAGFRWPTTCHGQAECTVCFVVVEQGADHFTSTEPRELAALGNVAGRSLYEGRTLRLACQARPTGDVVVRKRGVRPNVVKP